MNRRIRRSAVSCSVLLLIWLGTTAADPVIYERLDDFSVGNSDTITIAEQGVITDVDVDLHVTTSPSARHPQNRRDVRRQLHRVTKPSTPSK